MRLYSLRSLTLGLAVLMAAACGDDGGGADGDSDGTDGDRFPDASTIIADAGPTGGGGTCSAENYQCNNCEDDDGDNLTDGDDPECTGSIDDDEASFATGIPGDNKDDKWQDCFFDGNSGAGDDNCRWHTCCALGIEDGRDCEFEEECVAACVGLTPPGCDCFGCCTICDPDTDQCSDVLTNPAVSEGCDFDSLDDPAVCVPCAKSDLCTGGECDQQNCVLCPGQTEEDLPLDCNQMNECPDDKTPCDSSGDCADDEYCANSCCVDVVD